MKQRWTFRAYPTNEQKQQLAQVFGCARFVYNWGIDWRKSQFEAGNKVGYHESSAALTRLKKEEGKEWLREVSCVPVQQALRDLDVAYRNFFEKRTGYPKFRSKYDSKQSAEYTTSAMKFEDGVLSFSKLGVMDFSNSRGKIPQPSSVRVIKEADGRYFVSFCVEVEPAQFAKTGLTVGVDLGVSRLATLSTGEKIANPRNLYRYEQKLKTAQRKLARQKNGSKRRERQKQRLARLHSRIRDTRNDHLNKVAHSLVSRYDTICLEDLNIRGMVKNHNLARSLSDAALGAVVRKIESKANMHGKTVKFVDRFYPSSKTCSACGSINNRLTLSQRSWSCSCGACHDRDENAAKNIERVGLLTSSSPGQGERGGDVRPTARKRNGRTPSKRVLPV